MPLRGTRCSGAGALVASGGRPHRLADEAPAARRHHAPRPLTPALPLNTASLLSIRTREELTARLRLSSDELDSLLRLVGSQLDVSLRLLMAD